MDERLCSQGIAALICDGCYDDLLAPELNIGHAVIMGVSLSRMIEKIRTDPRYRVWVVITRNRLQHEDTHEASAHPFEPETPYQRGSMDQIYFLTMDNGEFVYHYPSIPGAVAMVFDPSATFETSETRRVRELVESTVKKLSWLVNRKLYPDDVAAIICEYLCYVNPVKDSRGYRGAPAVVHTSSTPISPSDLQLMTFNYPFLNVSDEYMDV